MRNKKPNSPNIGGGGEREREMGGECEKEKWRAKGVCKSECERERRKRETGM